VLSERITGKSVKPIEAQKAKFKRDDVWKSKSTKKTTAVRRIALGQHSPRRNAINDGMGGEGSSSKSAHTVKDVASTAVSRSRFVLNTFPSTPYAQMSGNVWGGIERPKLRAAVTRFIRIIHKHPLGRTTTDRNFVFNQLRLQGS
jgi:hypothetical protein